jgi:hypothetical protein
MFDAYCPGHRDRVVLGPDSTLSFGNAGTGLTVRWTCACGATGSAPWYAVTGGPRTRPPLHPAA